MKTIKEGKQRTPEDARALRDTVSAIIDEVRDRGDEALREYTGKFDGFIRKSFRVSREEIEAAYAQVTEVQLNDMKKAQANIRAFAEAQRASLTEVRDFSPLPGIYLSDRVLPVSSCLCYVPGGRFPLYSSALMLITPAKAAGVRRICAASPVDRKTGTLNPRTLVAMDLAGADEIYALGGAPAISAFSYGTETITPVDLIVGPGNQYVAEAKRQCYGQVGIDFVAGPSEVLAITDGSADPAVVAADLLAQCEHDPNAKAMLITTDEAFGQAVAQAVQDELVTLRQPQTAMQSWLTFGEIHVADSLEEACAEADRIAPEHLEVNTEDPEALLPLLHNYGSLFLGGNTAEVFGDYASGTNHTLPTLRAARYTGGVWVGTFLKVMTHQRMDPEASKAIAPLVNRMALGEGLEAHAVAALKRF